MTYDKTNLEHQLAEFDRSIDELASANYGGSLVESFIAQDGRASQRVPW
jgi:hypothetical protein